jgi:hypothetical protein
MGFFDDIGRQIKRSNDKIANDIHKSNDKIAHDIQKSNSTISNNFKNIPKPKIDMKALQTAVGIFAGVVALSPQGKAFLMVSTTIADKATGGKATAYLNNGHATNGTLSMLPGGFLAQQVLNDASGGKSGNALAKYVPDPKKMVIHEVSTLSNRNNNVTHNVIKEKHSIFHISPQISTLSPITTIFKSPLPIAINQEVKTTLSLPSISSQIIQQKTPETKKSIFTVALQKNTTPSVSTLGIKTSEVAVHPIIPPPMISKPSSTLPVIESPAENLPITVNNPVSTIDNKTVVVPDSKPKIPENVDISLIVSAIGIIAIIFCLL